MHCPIRHIKPNGIKGIHSESLGSRVSAWLLLSVVLCNPYTASAENLENRICLSFLAQLPAPDIIYAPAVAVEPIAGNIAALYDSPARLLLWDESQSDPEEYELSKDGIYSPSDLSSTGLSLMISDRFQNKIFRYDHRMKLLPAIQFPENDETLEPRSICVDANSNLFILNDVDQSVWKHDRLGVTGLFKWLGAAAEGIRNPIELNYLMSHDAIVITESSKLWIVPSTGTKVRQVALHGKYVSSSSESNITWAVGDGLICLNTKTNAVLHRSPVDSLKEWGVFPATDIKVINERIYILPSRGAGPVILQIDS